MPLRIRKLFAAPLYAVLGPAAMGMAICMTIGMTMATAPAFAQAPTTRLLVMVTRVKPEAVDEWLELQATQVVPALKRAGVTERDVYRTLIGEAAELEPLDGPPPIAKTLGPEGTAEFLRKGAGLNQPIGQLVFERLPALSF